MTITDIRDVGSHVDQEVTVRGWIYNFRSSGKIHFVLVRDGSGVIQCIADAGNLSADGAALVGTVTQESSVIVQGTIKQEPRAPGGYELHVSRIDAVQIAENYPIAKKEHGVDFLLDHRHLWIRSPRQRAILTVRDEVIWGLRKFFKEEGFRLTDTPILTPTSCEGTTTLFTTDYFGEPAYLSQSGQLYLEALAMSLGKVYDFGPVFRAEKSKTRRHLTEFWMLDAEMAFTGHTESMAVQEKMLKYVIGHVLKTCAEELRILERDVAKIQKLIAEPFVKMKYTQALEKLKSLGSDIRAGEDFGNDDETLLMNHYEVPVFVTHYPVALKAFYMQPDEEDPSFALCNDLLLPEGYGEVIGGSERIHDLELLIQRLREHGLPEKEFEWYLDLRRYGSVQHAGFGIGAERLVAYLCGLSHVRETIPFPRLLHRLRP